MIWGLEINAYSSYGKEKKEDTVMRVAKFVVSSLVLMAFALVLVNCGGGGGDSAPLQPPTYNVSGMWNITYYVTSSNCSGSPSGYLYRTYYITQAAGSYTLYIRDSRSSESQPGTISASTVSYSGPMYSEFGCSNMTGAFNVTLGDGTHFSGSGHVTCNDAPACTTNVTMTGYL
jgi:hypothetical protein